MEAAPLSPRPATDPGFRGVQVQAGEYDVPPLDLLGVGEAAAREFPATAMVVRGQVAWKGLPLAARGLQRPGQGGHPGDQFLDHAAIMADRGNDGDDAKATAREMRFQPRPARAAPPMNWRDGQTETADD